MVKNILLNALPWRKFLVETNTSPIVYVVNPAVAVTGAFVATQNAARLLKNQVRLVLVLPKNTRLTATDVQHFWRVEYIPMAVLSKSLWSLLLYFPALVFDAWRLKHLIRRDGATRLWLNDFYLMQGAMLLVLGVRCRIVTFVRCDPTLLMGRLAWPMLWLITRTSHQLISVSRYVQTLLGSRFPSTILYDAFYGKTRLSKQGPERTDKIFLYIGNYIEGKGQDVAIKAFAIAAKEDASIRLHFYGSDMGLPKNRAYLDKLKAAAQQAGLLDRIHFGDFLSDTYTVLESAYGALNFSGSESFSMTVLEAAGAGVAVIATASGGPQEIIRNGETGYLIPVGDYQTAAQRIITLANDPALAEQLGQAASADIRTRFSPEEYARNLKVILEVA